MSVKKIFMVLHTGTFLITGEAKRGAYSHRPVGVVVLYLNFVLDDRYNKQTLSLRSKNKSVAAVEFNTRRPQFRSQDRSKSALDSMASPAIQELKPQFWCWYDY